MLVLDEPFYISKVKYKIPYNMTINFIESIVLPEVDILPLAETECKEATKNY